MNRYGDDGSGGIDELVDGIVDDLLYRRRVDARTAELKALGAAAVPRLLRHLEAPERARKTMALYGLQYCWASAAEDVIRRYLADDDAELRRMAVIVLTKGAGFGKLVEACTPLLDDPRPEVACMGLDYLEAEAPDPARVRRLLRDSTFWTVLARHLARYHDPALTETTLELLDSREPRQVFGGIAGLINQNANAPAVRARVAARLAHEDGAVREMAAEYLAWHGRDTDLRPLRAALAGERDIHAAAAMRAAITAIGRRPDRPDPADIELPPAPDRRRAREAAVRALDAGAGPEDWAKAWAFYRTGELMEPHFAFRERSAGPDFVAARAARLRFQARLFAIPDGTEDKVDDAPYDGPPCDRVVTPVREFFDAERTNFGNRIEDSTADAFRGLVHIGDDMGWNRPHRTVAAVAAGIVRSVACVDTWGYLVIIEHRERDGDAFCTVYAHLGPFVAVVPGEQVVAGQKIGTIGRSYSWENGGYLAHLHFAVHKGPYLQPPRPGSVVDTRYQGRRYRGVVLRSDHTGAIVRIRTQRGLEAVLRTASWLCGYVSRAWWDAGDHGWAAPQAFLRRLGA
jgi:hypothetical protein